MSTTIDGQISEGDKESRLSVEKFKNQHEDVLLMSYEQANEMSLEEISFADDVRDQIWAENNRRLDVYKDKCYHAIIPMDYKMINQN